MSDTTRMWVEVIFNISYLIVVWGLVAAMLVRRAKVAPQNQRTAAVVLWAFGLLALGDTGHVGFRVWAYALGDLNARISVMGLSIGLIGLGTLMTSVTVTLFYMLMVEFWRTRFEKHYGWFGYLLLLAGIVRFVLMIPAANAWDSVTPPQPWSIIRNLPLMLQGLGVTYLILRDAITHRDRASLWVAGLILVSFACYIPVIFLAPQYPLVGMLMIPKTLAYLGVAVVAYIELYGYSRQAAIGSI